MTGTLIERVVEEELRTRELREQLAEEAENCKRLAVEFDRQAREQRDAAQVIRRAIAELDRGRDADRP